MYTTQNNRQREKYLDREEEEEVQVDVYNIEQQIDREIVTQRGGGGGGGTDRCIQHRTIDREIVTQRGGGGSRYKQMYIERQ